ncbi:hypothetical protein GGF46_004246 [Coemansia sp. RSA 552]|nr:hypothetical protein GGF46_004246 [Coemansia sp. RSA 552]
MGGGEMDSGEVRQEWTQRQAELRARVDQSDRHLGFGTAEEGFVGLQRVGGVDISYPRQTSGDTATVALVVLAFPSMDVLYAECQNVDIQVPYIPGFLAFREIHAYRQAIAHLQAVHPELMPQVIMVDGNGTLHPRRFGSACHLGVEMDVPAIGVAKNFLHIEGDLDGVDARGLKRLFRETAGLKEVELRGESGQVYGMAVGPPGMATNPVFVSTGHRISLATAVALVKQCSLHRVPEPIRVADQRSRAKARLLEG